jgi:hypothetical protein
VRVVPNRLRRRLFNKIACLLQRLLHIAGSGRMTSKFDQITVL